MLQGDAGFPHNPIEAPYDCWTCTLVIYSSLKMVHLGPRPNMPCLCKFVENLILHLNSFCLLTITPLFTSMQFNVLLCSLVYLIGNFILFYITITHLCILLFCILCILLDNCLNSNLLCIFLAYLIMSLVTCQTPCHMSLVKHRDGLQPTELI